jgi:mono/diheme cytochrome c family protein
MLLVRQFIQDKKLMPLEKQLQANAKTYQKELQPYHRGALNAYEADMHLVYDNGETIYLKSCALCHGEKADGNGTEAKSLAIPPEDISALRTTRFYLRQTLIDSVPGSSMPYFTFFDRDKLDGLTDYLNRRYSVLGLPKPIPVNIPDSTLQKARETYGATCTQCHGKDGTATKLSRGFKPPPPDFMVFSFSPERAFEIVTNGYPGTMMPAFGALPEEIRWGLVKIINEKRTP